MKKGQSILCLSLCIIAFASCTQKEQAPKDLMSVAGNENEDPRSNVIADEIEAGIGTLLQEAIVGKVPEEQYGNYVFLIKGMAMAHLKPYLMSMLTDTNQSNTWGRFFFV